jgi:nucleotide-binding universal stress UspA family protein
MPGIVVGVDGSTGAHKALEWAVREAAAHHAPLSVLTVHQVAVSFWTGSALAYAPDRQLEETARQLVEENVGKVIAELGDGAPAEVTVTAVSGAVAPELLAAAKDADLLVVGSRGGGGFGSLRLGSVSSQVVAHATCPVVVVPG